MEIWVSDRNGSNPVQLTALGRTGTPRWSPDSQSVVFDAGTRNGEAVDTVDLRGGAPRLVTPDGLVPSWSRDGKWIYISSNRSHNSQVWKAPASRGSPVQVTTQGGHAALESLDGSPLIRPFTWASWSVVEQGILFAGPSKREQTCPKPIRFRYASGKNG
jgi:Tol biopolymer transport system component